jgi:hypothetical protein
LGLPLTNPKWKPGDAWFDSPKLLHMYRRLAAVMDYVETEIGINDDLERNNLHQFLHGLHSAFCYRLDCGDNLTNITIPPEALKDYEEDFQLRIPSAVLIEKLREQFKNYGSTFYDADI